MEKIKYLDNNLKFLSKVNSFKAFESIEGEVFRKYENRITKKFQIKQKGYFIKFHGPVGWKEIFKNFIQIKAPVIGAQREYDALTHLAQNEINCPSIKAFGLKGFNPANSSSFLVTEELYGTISLEDFFLKGMHENLSFQEKKSLIKKVAELIRAMHDSGLNHRDLYLCHIHINTQLNFDNLELYLIDLHRAQLRSKVPGRWLVKDLGGFIHSILQFNLTERDFYRFMMAYFNCSLRELNQKQGYQIKKILKRAFRMYLKPKLLRPFSSIKKNNAINCNFSIFHDDSRKYILRKDQEEQKEEFLKFIEDEDLLINSGEVIKNEKGHLVVKVRILDQDYFIKKYRIKGFWHAISRILKSTRAYNSWQATLWLNAAGIKTAKPILLCEDQGILGAKNSYFVTESITDQRLDIAINQDHDSDFIVSIINAFFKRISWINFKHGDAKTSNFFVNKTLVAIDLDTSNKHYLDFFFIDNLSRDKKRMLKSLKGYNKIYSKLSKRLRRS